MHPWRSEDCSAVWSGSQEDEVVHARVPLIPIVGPEDYVRRIGWRVGESQLLADHHFIRDVGGFDGQDDDEFIGDQPERQGTRPSVSRAGVVRRLSVVAPACRNIFMTMPQAMRPPAPPIGWVRWSSGFSWMITAEPSSSNSAGTSPLATDTDTEDDEMRRAGVARRSAISDQASLSFLGFGLPRAREHAAGAVAGAVAARFEAR